MVEGDPGRRLCVIVVQGLRRQLVTEVTRLAAEYEVDVTLSDDVYAAVAELARSASPCALVIGPLRELAKENGRLFRVAVRNGARCCVWLDAESPGERTEVLSLVRAGVSVVEKIEEVRGTIEDWLTRTGRRLGPTRAADEEWLASEAELNALLGQEADG
jgi:hypothetical protein